MPPGDNPIAVNKYIVSYHVQGLQGWSKSLCTCFYIVIIRCLETFWSPCIWWRLYLFMLFSCLRRELETVYRHNNNFFVHLRTLLLVHIIWRRISTLRRVSKEVLWALSRHLLVGSELNQETTCRDSRCHGCNMNHAPPECDSHMLSLIPVALSARTVKVSLNSPKSITIHPPTSLSAKWSNSLGSTTKIVSALRLPRRTECCCSAPDAIKRTDSKSSPRRGYLPGWVANSRIYLWSRLKADGERSYNSSIWQWKET
jgi:hypothetical protein